MACGLSRQPSASRFGVVCLCLMSCHAVYSYHVRYSIRYTDKPAGARQTNTVHAGTVQYGTRPAPRTGPAPRADVGVIVAASLRSSADRLVAPPQAPPQLDASPSSRAAARIAVQPPRGTQTSAPPRRPRDGRREEGGCRRAAASLRHAIVTTESRRRCEALRTTPRTTPSTHCHPLGTSTARLAPLRPAPPPPPPCLAHAVAACGAKQRGAEGAREPAALGS